MTPESGVPPDPLRERFVRSFLDWVMLSVIAKKPTYGYDVIQVINDEFDVYISPGSLYPILYDLERSGLIAGSWDEPARRTRKVYRLTDEGARSLQDALDTIGGLLAGLRTEDHPPQRKVT